MNKVVRLTHKRLLDVLDYDPATGIFLWKIARSNRVKIGSRAGVVHQPSGGRYISIDGEKFMAHRLAWFYAKGAVSEIEIRPLDGNYDNCAIENLREISRVELSHVRDKQRNNTSGYLGVSKTVGDKWQATITWNYKQFSLGANFETAEAAHEAREEAVRRFTGKTTQAEYDEVMDGLRLWKGQRTAWRFLNRDHAKHGWSSFEKFCEDVSSVPKMRYAMIPLDMAKPIGPGNFDWAFPPEASRQSSEGIDAHNGARRGRQRDVLRDRDFRRKYGIDFAQYQEMLLAQKGVCASCEKPETRLHNGAIRMLSVDHNHATGAVRGLLCAGCNLAIGYACDDPVILTKCADYLRRYTPAEVIEFKPPRFDCDGADG